MIEDTNILLHCNWRRDVPEKFSVHSGCLAYRKKGSQLLDFKIPEILVFFWLILWKAGWWISWWLFSVKRYQISCSKCRFTAVICSIPHDFNKNDRRHEHSAMTQMDTEFPWKKFIWWSWLLGASWKPLWMKENIPGLLLRLIRFAGFWFLR